MQVVDQTELTAADILYLSLSHLGLSPSVESFDHRKQVQKVAYILQKCGVQLNYRYSWYLHGPYSSELTSDLYRIATQPEYFVAKTRDLDFIPAIHGRVDKLKGILGPVIGDTQVLEAIASILYIGPGWKKIIRSVKPALGESVLKKAQGVIRMLIDHSLIDKRQVE